MGKLTDLIKGLFNIETYERRNPVVAALQAVQTQFLRVNDDRVAFLIVNLGVNVAYILNAQDVSATNGILIGANGGSINTIYSEDFFLVGEAWYGIAPAGAVNILVIEVLAR